MMLKKIKGWWCPYCHCLMMAKTRVSITDNREMIACDCYDIYEGKDINTNKLSKKQADWYPLYIQSRPEKGTT